MIGHYLTLFRIRFCTWRGRINLDKSEMFLDLCQRAKQAKDVEQYWAFYNMGQTYYNRSYKWYRRAGDNFPLIMAMRAR